MVSVKNYDRTVAMAERLIIKYGRKVSAVKFTKTPDSSSERWKGTADIRDSADNVTENFSAVFAQPTGEDKLGKSTISADLAKRSEQILLVSPGKKTIKSDLAEFNEIIDTDGSKWKIEGVETLKPGNVVLLYYIGVKR